MDDTGLEPVTRGFNIRVSAVQGSNRPASSLRSAGQPGGTLLPRRLQKSLLVLKMPTDESLSVYRLWYINARGVLSYEKQLAP